MRQSRRKALASGASILLAQRPLAPRPPTWRPPRRARRAGPRRSRSSPARGSSGARGGGRPVPLFEPELLRRELECFARSRRSGGCRKPLRDELRPRVARVHLGEDLVGVAARGRPTWSVGYFSAGAQLPPVGQRRPPASTVSSRHTSSSSASASLLYPQSEKRREASTSASATSDVRVGGGVLVDHRSLPLPGEESIAPADLQVLACPAPHLVEGGAVAGEDGAQERIALPLRGGDARLVARHHPAALDEAVAVEAPQRGELVGVASAGVAAAHGRGRGVGGAREERRGERDEDGEPGHVVLGCA